MENDTQYWRKCSSCKKELAYSSKYWVCNVSSCNRKRSSLVFCTVSCWDAHLPVMRHREAWAEERVSPSQSEVQAASAIKSPAVTNSSAKHNPDNTAPDNSDVLVVASKVKDYIKSKSGMSTSASAFIALSNHMRHISDIAISSAKQDERQTVFDRDIPSRNSESKPSTFIRRRVSED